MGERPLDVRVYGGYTYTVLHTSPLAEFLDAFHTKERVQGLTHDFYKYPARFSPRFARYIVELFTEPGDTVFDPFMGGGTTIVESVAAGRYAAGTDVNELARFVTKAKTTPLSKGDMKEIRKWVDRVNEATESATHTSGPADAGLRHLPPNMYAFFSAAMQLISILKFARCRTFARCALIRVGQWALDGRSSLAEPRQMANALDRIVSQMIAGLEQFVVSASAVGLQKNKITSRRKLSIRSATDSRLKGMLNRWQAKPRLVLTSPPYPGVHVLYNRWQVHGRRETAAPYWIANLRDGNNEAYYTMGGRSVSGLRKYFEQLLVAFANLRDVVADDATIVQLIAFTDTESQLPKFLEAMAAAGFREHHSHYLPNRHIRSVPNRRWYNWNRTGNGASREILLIHEPA